MSTFAILFLSWFLRATVVNFPCDQIPASADYSCEDVGYCYMDYMTGTGVCMEDTCVKTTTESAGCSGGSCQLRYWDSDWDCATDTAVNKTGFYCINNQNWLDNCFYDHLKSGTCGSGCKLITLQSKSACINDNSSPSSDYCNEYSTNECEISTTSCFVQNGKCVRDVCRNTSVSWTGSACSPNSTCVGRDRYQRDPITGTVSLTKFCLDPNHTNYNKCGQIGIYDYVPTGVGSCINKVVHNEWCTANDGCKVVTYQGEPGCSSIDPPTSSALAVHVSTVLAFLAMAVFVLAFSA